MLSQVVAKNKVMVSILVMFSVEKSGELRQFLVEKFAKKIFSRFALYKNWIFSAPEKVFYPLDFRFAKILSTPVILFGAEKFFSLLQLNFR